MSPGFPAQHEKARITKDLHICQRFGAEGKGKAIYYISKSSESKLSSFGMLFMKLQGQSRRVLTAFHLWPLFRSARGYNRRQEGGWNEMQAIIGSEAWMWWLGSFTGLLQPCWDWIKSCSHFYSHYPGFEWATWLANASKTFSNTLLNSVCTGKRMIWFGLRRMLLSVGMHHIILLYCCETLICQEILQAVEHNLSLHWVQEQDEVLHSPRWCWGWGCGPDLLLAAWRWASGMRWHASNLSSSCTWQKENPNQFVRKEDRIVGGRRE